jgi:DNA polymerase-3 subunit delta'
MSAPRPPIDTLGTKLCPWLAPALERLRSARHARRLGHAWLIAGPAGIGKLNLALAAAHELLHGAATPPEMLGPAEAVAALAARHLPADHHADLHWIHPEEDKNTISVEQIRDLIAAISLTAHHGAAKVVIIEPADAMTAPAANALLKTLEEPAGDAYLFLLSHQPDRLPATIRSRCQRLDVRRPEPSILSAWLGVEDAAVAAAWQMTGGAPLRMAALLAQKESLKNNELESDIAAIADDTADPAAVAKAWAEGDTELALTWLAGELHAEVRRRLGGAGSTAVTVRGAAALHNAWRPLTLRTLFEQYDKAARLLNQLGSGISLELATQALLVGFQANRGQS